MQTIGFIGSGNMAYAIISGLINQGYDQDYIKITDTNAALLSQRKAELGVEVFNNNTDLVSHVDVLVLAVKPQALKGVCQELSHCSQQKPMIISIAAGVKITSIEDWLGGNQTIIRTMPNTPALFNQGMSGVFTHHHLDTQQKSLIETILTATGKMIWLDNEDLLDAVTAVSGSGPAYFFLLLEAMTKTGVSLGLSPADAKQLSIQTALGSAVMASQSDDSPTLLREKVTSPNGTTQAAVETFQSQNFEKIVAKAMRAAFDRAQEMGRET